MIAGHLVHPPRVIATYDSHYLPPATRPEQSVLRPVMDAQDIILDVMSSWNDVIARPSFDGLSFVRANYPG